MATSAVGSICVDFAGTLDEAREFAKEHGVCAPQNHLYREALEANGCAVITIPYRTKAERVEAIARMEALGNGDWSDTGSWRIRERPKYVGGMRVARS